MSVRSLSIAALAVLACCAAAVAAWSVPIELSAASGNERSTPKIAPSAGGGVYAVYMNKGSPWTVWFRAKSAGGSWGAVEHISGTNAGSAHPDVAEDAQGRPHVVYAQYLTDGHLDLVHAYKAGGAWTTTALNTTSDYEDEPSLARDSQGRIHMLFTRGATESDAASIIYRVWNGSSWGTETDIGHTDRAYFRRPQIFIDTQDVIHGVWGDASGSVYKIYYARCVNGSWQPTLEVGSGSDWPSYPKVAAATPSNILVVWDDTQTYYNYSNNGGASWAYAPGNSQGQMFSADRAPVVDGRSGVVHMITTMAPGNRAVGYSQWNGSAWTLIDQVVLSDSNWKGWPDVALDAAGNVHAVWDQAYGPATWQHMIDYSTTALDARPAAVSGFTATAAHNHVPLTWTNPYDPDFIRTIVRVSTTGYPVLPTDGTLLADLAGAPGSAGSVDHTGVVNGTRYFYAAFAKDAGGQYSIRAIASATPFMPPDLDRDLDVDQDDFGLLQACLSGPFTDQDDPACQDAKMDGDSDVDAGDVEIYSGCISGPGTRYVSTCAD